MTRSTWTRTRAAQELDEIARLGAEIEHRFTALFLNSGEALRDQYNSSDEFGLDLDGLRRRARELAAALREADRRELLNATAEAGYLHPREFVEAVTDKPGFDGRDGGRMNEHASAQESAS